MKLTDSLLRKWNDSPNEEDTLREVEAIVSMYSGLASIVYIPQATDKQTELYLSMLSDFRTSLKEIFGEDFVKKIDERVRNFMASSVGAEILEDGIKLLNKHLNL